MSSPQEAGPGLRGQVPRADDDLGAGPPGEHIERICLRNLLASTNEAVYFKDRDSRFLVVSRGVIQHHIEHQQRIGAYVEGEVGPDYFVGKSDLDLFDVAVATAWIEEEQRIMETSEPIVDVLERDTTSDNVGGWFRTSKAPLRDDNGTIIGTFGISRDVTEQVKAQLELVRREAQLRAVLDSSPDAIACYNQDLRYEMVNAQAVALLGTPADQVVGHTDAELGRPAEIINPLLEGLGRVLARKEMYQDEYSTVSDGTTKWWHVRMVPQLAPDGSVSGVIVVTRDLTELKAAQSVLTHQALHDPLTGLVNRVALVDRVNHALADLQRNPGRLALLFIDLDNFKPINDARGHDVGDQLLVEVASRLNAVTRRADTVARLGGDEFVILLDRLSAPDDAYLLASRVLSSLSQPFVHRGERLTLTASIGVAVTDDAGSNAGDLLRDADVAMYRAKENGRDRIEFFHPILRGQAEDRQKLVRELSEAIDTGQFFLMYQPFFSLEDHALVGVEALVRWQHPEHGVVAPGEFISLAEELGLIHALGAWVLDEACRQLSEWDVPRPQGLRFVMAVNVSALQLAAPGFAEVVTTTIDKHHISPHQLCLEITEAGMAEDCGQHGKVMGALADLGVRLALDDFGTGYSSLAHLHAFRVNTLKIDRSLVERLSTESGDRQMVAGVVAMAHALGMDVVAEGVETDEQWRKVTDMDCDDAQGFFFARPLSPDMIGPLLAAQDPATPALLARRSSPDFSVSAGRPSRRRGAGGTRSPAPGPR